MATYTIDTAAAMERLEHGGLDHDQAKAIVDTFREAHEELFSKEHFDTEMSLLRKDVEGLKGWMTTRMLMAQVGTVAALYGLIRLFGVG